MKEPVISVTAFLMAENFYLKQFKAEYTGKLISGSSSDAFYQMEENGYLFVLNYGVAVFANVSDAEMTKTLALLSDYASLPLKNKMREDYALSQSGEENFKIEFDQIRVNEITPELIKIVMLNLAHSLALDFYDGVAEKLLLDVKRYATQLEKNGRIRGSKKDMLRFIGKILSVKNRIIENLYIFDVPEMVWENLELDRIHTGLSKLFDLRVRFKEIEYTFKIIEDNLGVFSELFQHKESNRLEWIIIVLILIEVVNLFLEKLF